MNNNKIFLNKINKNLKKNGSLAYVAIAGDMLQVSTGGMMALLSKEVSCPPALTVHYCLRHDAAMGNCSDGTVSTQG